MFNDYACFSHYMQFLEPIVLLVYFDPFGVWPRSLNHNLGQVKWWSKCMKHIQYTLRHFLASNTNFTSDFKSQVHSLTVEIL